MNNLTDQLQLIIQERDVLALEQVRWQKKWDDLMALDTEIDQKKTEMIALTKEHELIVQRVGILIEKQSKLHADLKQKIFVLNSPVVSKEIQ